MVLVVWFSLLVSINIALVDFPFISLFSFCPFRSIVLQTAELAPSMV